jgi:hypothetical protein
VQPSAEEAGFWRSVGATAVARLEQEQIVSPAAFAALNRAIAAARAGGAGSP